MLADSAEEFAFNASWIGIQRNEQLVRIKSANIALFGKNDAFDFVGLFFAVGQRRSQKNISVEAIKKFDSINDSY